MADNRKMVATCQGSTCRKTLTSAAEKNAYGSLAFSPERKELTHCRDFTGRSEFLPQAVLHFGQRKALPSSAVTGKPQTFGGRVSIDLKVQFQFWRRMYVRRLMNASHGNVMRSQGRRGKQSRHDNQNLNLKYHAIMNLTPAGSPVWVLLTAFLAA